MATAVRVDSGPVAAGHPIFAGIEPAELERHLHGLSPRVLQSGSILSKVEPALHLVLAGSLHGYVTAPDGGRVLIEIIGPGGVDGYLAMTGHQAHISQAAELTTVLTIPRTRWNAIVQAHPGALVNALAIILERLEMRERQLAAFAHRDARKRLASQLLVLSAAGTDGSLPFRVTHQDLAEMLGVRRETVTLTLHRLEHAGAVQLRRGRLRRVNIQELQRIIGAN